MRVTILNNPKFVLLVYLTNLFFFTVVRSERIAIIGTGYVGLVCAGTLSSFGHDIVCYDIDKQKIQRLADGVLPLYEPLVDQMLFKKSAVRKVFFTSDLKEAVKDSQVILVAVGTPLDRTGNKNLSALEDAITTIAPVLTDYKVICIKSTIPPGTSEKMKKSIQQACGHDNFGLVVNPEFMREGSALSDLFEKNPIVLGSDSDNANAIVEAIYRPLLEKGRVLIKTNFITAELIKYAWNAFSFIKVAYVDELAHVCKELNGDIADVVTGIAYSDAILPMSAIKPGPGIGGSCLPKDTRAFLNYAQALGQPLNILQASVQSDLDHQQWVLNEIYKLLGNKAKNKTVAILGLSYKANTDDIRNAPSLKIIESLLTDGAIIQAYDPKAMDGMRTQFPTIEYCNSVYQSVKRADLLILLTDWEEFKNLDFDRIFALMKQPIIFDTRNLWDPKSLLQAGFTVRNLGRVS